LNLRSIAKKTDALLKVESKRCALDYATARGMPIRKIQGST
jgi:hypothetical protein